LTLLVDDGVNGHGRLTRLPVADDQLALTPSDGDHGIDRLDTRLQRLFHVLAVDDPRRVGLDGPPLVGANGRTSVQRLAQRVHNPADQLFAHGHFNDPAGSLYGGPFLNIFEGAHNDATDVI